MTNQQLAEKETLMPKEAGYISRLLQPILITALVGFVVLLTLQNHQLRTQLESLQTPELTTLGPGDKRTELKLLTIDGNTMDVSLSQTGRPHMIFFLSTTCKACSQSLRYWNEIISLARPKGWEIIPISIHSAEQTYEFVISHGISYPVFVARDTTVRESFKVRFVPQTMLIDDLGVVRNHWSGVVDSIKREEIIKGILDASIK